LLPLLVVKCLFFCTEFVAHLSLFTTDTGNKIIAGMSIGVESPPFVRSFSSLDDGRRTTLELIKLKAKLKYNREGLIGPFKNMKTIPTVIQNRMVFER
jgi:hypothetical protein